VEIDCDDVRGEPIKVRKDALNSSYEGRTGLPMSQPIDAQGGPADNCV
jgi:hypothetical protein